MLQDEHATVKYVKALVYIENNRKAVPKMHSVWTACFFFTQIQIFILNSTNIQNSKFMNPQMIKKFP